MQKAPQPLRSLASLTARASTFLQRRPACAKGQACFRAPIEQVHSAVAQIALAPWLVCRCAKRAKRGRARLAFFQDSKAPRARALSRDLLCVPRWFLSFVHSSLGELWLKSLVLSVFIIASGSSLKFRGARFPYTAPHTRPRAQAEVSRPTTSAHLTISSSAVTSDTRKLA
jgi:hypothetical protein